MISQEGFHLSKHLTGAYTFDLLSIPKHFFNNDVSLIRFLLDVADALIVGLSTVTKQQTKLVGGTRLALPYLLYCLVPDFFRMSMLSCSSAMSIMALSNLL